MLPDFTGVLAVNNFDIDTQKWGFEYRIYVQGRKPYVSDFSVREDAEAELAIELDRLAATADQ